MNFDLNHPVLFWAFMPWAFFGIVYALCCLTFAIAGRIEARRDAKFAAEFPVIAAWQGDPSSGVIAEPCAFCGPVDESEPTPTHDDLAAEYVVREAERLLGGAS